MQFCVRSVLQTGTYFTYRRRFGRLSLCLFSTGLYSMQYVVAPAYAPNTLSFVIPGKCLRFRCRFASMHWCVPWHVSLRKRSRPICFGLAEHINNENVPGTWYVGSLRDFLRGFLLATGYLHDQRSKFALGVPKGKHKLCIWWVINLYGKRTRGTVGVL